MAWAVDYKEVNAVLAPATTPANAVAMPIPEALCREFIPCSRESMDDFS
jgi:hypothetical protein